MQHTADQPNLDRAVDYVACMTDRFALRQHTELFPQKTNGGAK